MTRPPRLPRFSPSRLSLYRECPRAYLFRYDRKWAWGGTSPGQSFGGSLHRALQTFHVRGGPASISLDELLRVLRSSWSSAGYDSDEQQVEFLALGDEILTTYHDQSARSGHVVLATETTLQQRYATFILFGRVDRLDRRPDGSLEVVDYKSGRHEHTQEDVKNSLALAIYQLLVARENPGTTVYTGVLDLRTGKSVFALRSPDELDALEVELGDLVTTIQGDVDKWPTPGDPCRSCPYPRFCPKGRAWLAAHDE